MQNIKKMLLSFLVFIILAGCWDRNEISDLNFVMGIAVDITDEEKYRITFQWALPSQFSTEGSQGTGNINENSIYSIEGDTMALAMNKLTEISPRTPIYSHMALIVIGEKVAQKGVEEVFEVFDREFEMRRTIQVMFAKEKGEDILRSKIPFETVTATGIHNIATYVNRSSTMKEITLNEFYIHESDNDSLSYMPIVETVANTSLTSTEDTPQKSWVRVNRIALFDNYKLITELSWEDSRSMLYALGEIKDRTITDIKTTNKGRLLTRTISQISNIQFETKGNNPSATISIKENVSILGKPDNISITDMEKEIEEYIGNSMKRSIEKMQEENLDIFFLRKKIRERHPETWEKVKHSWNETYSNMKIVVNVSVTIDHQNALRKNSQD
ncbi:Ger(x)C family spore germination protein [Sediminibacillus massiliensis]|uniref:Ger(x)C family spore germination protein n=1 Tax=Sediminibacillus massiliensis TaxID=1926277 RepID=UPI0009886532|nr:Ger(x)C family spore germination protein [Sediminibacillus massiliensis]